MNHAKIHGTLNSDEKLGGSGQRRFEFTTFRCPLRVKTP